MNSDDFELKIKNYKVPSNARDLVTRANVVFVAGITGAGKNTVLNRLLEDSKYKRIISHTTRQPRSNQGLMERDGVEYHFINIEEAKSMIEAQEFVEVKFVHGNIYGTSTAEIESAYKNNKTAISDIDVQGVAEYKAISSEVTAIFLLPPDYETWQKRLMHRYSGQPDEADIKKRLQTAKAELQEALAKDYFEFVINDDLDRAVEAVDLIVEGLVSRAKNREARQIAQRILQHLS